VKRESESEMGGEGERGKKKRGETTNPGQEKQPGREMANFPGNDKPPNSKTRQ